MNWPVRLIILFAGLSSSAAAADEPEVFWMKVGGEYRLGRIVIEASERRFMTCNEIEYPLDETTLTPADIGCAQDPFFVAGEVTGTISRIDLATNTFVIDGRTFTASPTNTVGAKLRDLKNGDTVRLSVATQDLNTGKQPFNVMSMQKVE